MTQTSAVSPRTRPPALLLAAVFTASLLFHGCVAVSDLDTPAPPAQNSDQDGGPNTDADTDDNTPDADDNGSNNGEHDADTSEDANDVFEDTSTDTAEDVPEDVPEDTPEDIAEDAPEDTPEDTPEDIAEDTAEDVAQDVPEDVAEDTTEDIAEDVLTDTSEDVTEDAAEDVTEDATPDGGDDDGGMDTTPDPPTPALRRDVTGDGIPDIAFTAPLAFQIFVVPGAHGISSTSPPNAATFIQRSVQPAHRGKDIAITHVGDLNGDGHAEVVYSCPAVGPSVGHVVIYDGAEFAANSGQPTTLQGPAGFGHALSTAVDLDGDLYDDLIVGSPPEGVVHVYWGGPDGVSADHHLTITRPSEAGARSWGASLAVSPDITGDGRGELYVGALAGMEPNASGQVYHVNVDRTVAPSATLIAEGVDQPLFGASLAAGTIRVRPGEEHLIIGRNRGAELELTWINGLFQNIIGDTFDLPDQAHGLIVDAGGDVDGDGFSDLLVGGAAGIFQYVRIDRVDVNNMQALALERFNLGIPGAPCNLPGPRTLAFTGDFNADGFDDFLLGEPVCHRIHVLMGGPRDGEGGINATYLTLLLDGSRAGFSLGDGRAPWMP